MHHCSLPYFLFQSTPSAWRETFSSIHAFASCFISIHSLRMEGDLGFVNYIAAQTNFNPLPPHGGRRTCSSCFLTASWISIHSLRMEGDDGSYPFTDSIVIFQSTPSAWRETFLLSSPSAETTHFNPLPPHGGRPGWMSISLSAHPFQSTPSAWRETFRSNSPCSIAIISIHSLRMEGDVAVPVDGVGNLNFNPLPPHGGRHGATWRSSQRLPISIHSLRMEGDADRLGCNAGNTISIHSLRMEGDSKTAQESVFHFAYPCTILQKRMQKTTFCTRKNGFFRKKGEKFGAKPSASFCAPMIRTDTFPLNFSHRISGSSMSMVSFAPICSTFD